jgi:hypothetical protein
LSLDDSDSLVHKEELMADQFVAPTPSFAPNPDILAAYIRGQMAPGAVQQQQQQLQTGALNIQQIQLALQNQQLLQGIGRSYADSYMNGGAPGATAQMAPPALRARVATDPPRVAYRMARRALYPALVVQFLVLLPYHHPRQAQ